MLPSLGQHLGDWLAQPAVVTLVTLMLCSAFAVSGITKALHFDAATAEMEQLGLPLPALAAALTILVQLGGSAMVVSGYTAWLGAIALAGLVLAATMLAHDFWNHEGDERAAALNTFLEHLGLIAGFLLVIALVRAQGAAGG